MDKIIVSNNVQKTRETESKRFNFVWGFVGTNRTGKSITALEYAKKWKESRPEHHKIVAFDPQKRFANIADEFIGPEEKDWALDPTRFKNSLLILDDYKIINESDRPVPGLANLMYYRADQNTDIIYICHNPSLVINVLTYFTSHYFLFYSEAMDGSFKKKIMNYRLCVQGQRLINDYVNAYGRGKYPVFPHVIVDCEERELFAVNMNKTGSTNQNKSRPNSLR